MTEPAPVPLDDERILDTLNRHGVRYVVIGGYGAVLHGSLLTTNDVDITPDTSPENLVRLADALIELEARLRVHGSREPVEMPLDAETFGSFTTMTLRTGAGDLDVALRPDAPPSAPGGPVSHFDYDRLARDALLVEMPVPVPVASLDDIIASKEAAGRTKDLERLPELYRLRDAINARDASGDTSADP